MLFRSDPGRADGSDRTLIGTITELTIRHQGRKPISNAVISDGTDSVKIALAHVQFETIHPFEDGNGWTGRILNLLFLVEQGLLRLPILYMSGAIIRSKADYYRLLLEVTTAERWEPWLLYVLRTVDETSRSTTAKIRAVREQLHRATHYVRAEAPKIYSRELVQVIFEQPYCRIANLVAAGIAKRQTASEYLAKLSEIGLLTSVQVGREKLFVHKALLSLLASDTNDVTSYRRPV